MFLKSLQWRLVSFFCIISFCLIIPIGLFLNKEVEDSYYKTFKAGIENGFKAWNDEKFINTDVKQVFEEITNNYAVLFSIIGQNKSFTVVDSSNNEIYSSDSRFGEDKDKFFNDLLRSDNFVSAMKGESGGKKKLMSYNGVQFFDYAKPVAGGRFVLYFRYYKDEWKEILDNSNRAILTSLVVAFVVAFILGYMLSKTITVPIVRIMQNAQRLASGDFEHVLEVKSDDEIGKLTSAFNYMAKSLKDTLAEISSEKSKIETILDYMTDGVVAFNMKGEVIHANPAARKMLGSNVFDRTFDDYAKEYNFGFSLEDIIYIESLGNREANIAIGDKIIKAYFAVFSDKAKRPEGIIAVLHDITEQEKLENMRKEFVANVSHELRTPLTSIKSYAETLMDGALEDRETTEKFLGVINTEADRMTRLVKDLLQLSRLDNLQMRWNMQDISIVDLVRGSVEKMALEAKNKGQQLEFYVIGDIPLVRADYDGIEQVVLNVLSNAIKYTPENGKITVYVSRIYNEVQIKVVDTGIGIPKEDIPRVFERFYRVDKARSREMGGTGLGLSIAKEIIEAHSGSVAIKSEPGKGTEVILKLPVPEMEGVI
ncbi:MAG TPA: cell wall metabolism sensor histidine kinase WalK [Clostridiaceae bacterium]|nr:cell wall metabolism sensor histidine kinase WalK [Clostridiaceae bacterium]